MRLKKPENGFTNTYLRNAYVTNPVGPIFYTTPTLPVHMNTHFWETVKLIVAGLLCH